MSTRILGQGLLPSIFAVICALILSSCGGSSDTEDKAPAPASCETSQATVATASFDALWTNVFSAQCGSCHGSGTYSGTEGGPDLRTKTSFYSSLVGKKGSDYPQWNVMLGNQYDCRNVPLIGANNAAESLVVAVLDRSINLGECKPKIHLDIPQSICITQPNLVKLKEWINAGAAQ